MREISLLGTVKIENSEGTVPRIRSRRTMALLGYLAAERRPISREFLATFFWPDDVPAKGRANLRRELHNLAQILPGCWQANRNDVRFVPAEETAVDIYQFLNHEAAQEWSEAAELISGDFLEGIILNDNLEYETWLLGEQERWRQRSQTVLNHLIDWHSRNIQYNEALHYARQLLQIAPWNEVVHRQVMLILARSGQRAAALRQHEQCKAALWEELAVEPSAETTTLYERILDGEIAQEKGTPTADWESQTSLASHLPRPLTEFVGRETEINAITALLSENSLINLVGPGGIGKTRLAIAAAEAVKDEFEQGVHFVSLLTHESPTAVVPAIADVLGLSLKEGRSPNDQLQVFLQPYKMLLLLDNLEHLLSGPEREWEFGGVEMIIEELMAAAPELQILGTSRELLRLPQETVFPVEGLTVEEAEVDYGSAVTLFCRRAAQKQPDLVFNPPQLESIRDFCHQVEGMPLAIELAAAQMRKISLANFNEAVASNLDAFDAGIRGVSARHRSIRIVFEASWDSLTTYEQLVFAGLSTFQGGISLTGAAQVAQASLSDLGVLLDKSLMRLGGDGRYKRHPLIRTFSAEKLAEMGDERAAARERHFDYFNKVLKGAIVVWQQSRQMKDLQILKVEADNLRLAWYWIREQKDPETAVAYMDDYWQFLRAAGRLSEGIELLNQAITQDKTADPPLDPRYLAHWERLLGESYMWMSQMGVGNEHLTRALTTLNIDMPQNDRRKIFAIVTELAKQTGHRLLPKFLIGRQEKNQAALQDAIIAYRSLGNRATVELDTLTGAYCILRQINLAEAASLSVYLAEAYITMGMMMGLVPWVGAADYYIQKAEKLVEEEENLQARGSVLTYGGLYYFGLGQWSKAKQHLQRGADVLEMLGHWWMLGTNFAIASFLALQRGEYQESLHYARLFGILGQERGDPGFIAADYYWRALVELRRNHLDQAHEYLHKSAAAPAEVMNRFDWLVVYAAQGLVYLRQGKVEKAQKEVEKCLDLIDGIDRPSHTISLASYDNLARVCVSLWAVNPDRLDANVARTQAELACAKLEGLAKIFPIGRPAAALHRGSFYWLDGRQENARASWQKSFSHAKELDMPYEQGLAHHELGRHNFATGDMQAQEHLAQACRIFRNLGTPYELALAEAGS